MERIGIIITENTSSREKLKLYDNLIYFGQPIYSQYKSAHFRTEQSL